MTGRALLVVLASLAGPPVLAAQASPPPTAHAWVSAGLGASNVGFGASGGVDLLVRRHLVSFRAAGVAEILGDDFWDAGLLYGRAVRWSRGLAGASAGLGVMGGNYCSLFSGCRTVDPRVSLPLAWRMSWHVLPVLGVGIYGFANVNSVKSFGGVTLSLELGRLR